MLTKNRALGCLLRIWIGRSARTNSFGTKPSFINRRLLGFLCILLATSSITHAQGSDCNAPSFNSPQSFNAGPNPISVAAGDLNGDGIPDLVVPNVASDTFNILFGDGAGAFLPPISYPVGIKGSTVEAAPQDAAIGDFNGDGKPDVIVVGGYSQGWVSVLLGDGTGNFGPALNQATGEGRLTGVVLGDFNGDNKKDIAVAGTSSYKISFLLGNGTGGFASISAVTTTSEPGEIAAGDLNGDGLADVVTTNEYPTWRLTVVLGRSDGNFVLNQSITTRSQPDAIAIADLNEDSKLDIAITFGWADHGIELRFGDGTGSFSEPTTISTVHEATELATSDLNNDGKMDLIVHLSSASAVSVYLGFGGGHFNPPVSYGTLPDLSRGLATADFNQDGKTDLVSVHAAGVALLLGDSAGAFAAPRLIVFGNLRGGPVVTADFNGDGRPDLATPAAFSPNLAVYLTDASGRFSGSTFFPIGKNAESMASGDFNNDGKVDLVIGHDFSSNPGKVSVLLGNGSGGFAGPTTFTVATANIPSRVIVVGKFDGDNNQDLAVLQEFISGSTIVSILRGDGAGGFSAPSFITINQRAEWLDSGDFNGDGKLDLAFANSFPAANISLLLGDGAGSFTPSPSLSAIPIRAEYLRAADLNKDGLPDLITLHQSTKQVGILLNNGAGFNSPLMVSTVATPYSVVVGDFNLDTNQDLAIGATSALGNAVVMSGDGLGNFGPPHFFTVGGSGALGVADFNSDGKPDLVTGNYAGILLNTFTVLPCLSINDVSLTEGDSGNINADFIVSLSAPSAETVRVNYVASGINATKATDFTAVSGRISFAPGETSKTVSVPVAADMVDEIDETFKVQLSNPTKAGISDNEGIGTILDNDPVPALRINDSAGTEGFFSRNFVVTLSSPSGKTITVDYATTNGTATGGTQSGQTDYFTTSGTLTIPAGQTTANISVNVFGENMFEPDETFFLNLSNPTNATIEDGQAQGTIVNDDPIPTFSMYDAFISEGNSGTQNGVFNLILTNPSYLPITFNFSTSDDTATAGSDYVASSGMVTFEPGETNRTLTVLVNGDVVDEIDETFLLNISGLQNATTSQGLAKGFIFDDDGPTISIDDVSVKEGTGGTTSAIFTVTLSAPSVQQVFVRARPAPGTASQGSDYSGSVFIVTLPPGTVTKTFAVSIVTDNLVEPDETFFVNLTEPVNGTIADAQGMATILNDDATSQFGAALYTANEAGGNATIIVNRTGDTSSAATVDYLTSDSAALNECNVMNGAGSSRCDYATSIGTLRFAAGETSKTIFVPIVDDGYAEGNETFTVTLSNPTGTTLGATTAATVTIQDNDSSSGANPIDGNDFFIRQQYIDFLGREPDPGGLAGWRNVLVNCGITVAPPCDRIEVSAGFFRSEEFQSRGYFIYRFFSALGRIPVSEEFYPDFAKVSGFLTADQLEANKAAYVNEVMARADFQTKYGSTLSNPTAYVEALLQTVGLPSHTSKQSWINTLNASNTTTTRGQVLRQLVESPEVFNKYYNEAFVIMQYFGYLRRTADASYLSWINTMNQTNGDYRTMINGFMNSAEYRRRFGP